jgi:hypothetical protein
MDFIKRNTYQKPVLTGISLMLIALAFRLIDIFILRLDERLERSSYLRRWDSCWFYCLFGPWAGNQPRLAFTAENWVRVYC